MEHAKHHESTLFTCVMIAFAVLVVLVQGFFAFFVVGDLGQPTWDYRPVKDVPGESPYAIYELIEDGQHIRGAKGE